jgi:hypothetical protein
VAAACVERPCSTASGNLSDNYNDCFLPPYQQPPQLPRLTFEFFHSHAGAVPEGRCQRACQIQGPRTAAGWAAGALACRHRLSRACRAAAQLEPAGWAAAAAARALFHLQKPGMRGGGNAAMQPAATQPPAPALQTQQQLRRRRAATAATQQGWPAPAGRPCDLHPQPQQQPQPSQAATAAANTRRSSKPGRRAAQDSSKKHSKSLDDW